ncbi:MAG: hypothetical protein UY60_C0006G0002 [Parcubacteria group bacterium GW2011_GWB1_50_9]|nr:MAG: hypothetical protein UY60_C0006G0002 [Parcubacteria group bacterium GW2011_GWB1_50_9]
MDAIGSSILLDVYHIKMNQRVKLFAAHIANKLLHASYLNHPSSPSH